MIKNKIIILFLFALTLAPRFALAIQMPQNGNDLADMAGIDADAYVVMNAQTGQILIEKNSDQQFAPASLTKLVTALVVMDTKTKLYKSVVMTQYDQDLGACNSGGACIKTRPGVKFTVDGLFHAALLPSANNAASALARSTGLSNAAFVARMNAKVKSLGATNSIFYEPTGMNSSNQITAADYAKIVKAAFSNSYLKNVAGQKTFVLKSTNNRKYNQTIKNTDKLLSNTDLRVLGAKTGWLGDKYNFASVLKYRDDAPVAIVVLGENHLYSAFDETAMLASLAKMAQLLAK